MESVEFLGRYRLTQSDACFKLGRDSVLLAGFAPCAPRWSVCDLGCGVGSLLLLLSQREEALDRVGVELDPVAAGLARGTCRTTAWRDKFLPETSGTAPC